MPIGLNDFVEKDDCCFCNYAAIRATLNFLDDEDIVYVSFHNNFLETPFFVAIDRETKAVVVAVRGTLSMGDVLTDLVNIFKKFFFGRANGFQMILVSKTSKIPSSFERGSPKHVRFSL